jgi:hypothetical protein
MMKTFSRFIATVVLTMSLTFVAFAGDIQTPGAISQPTVPDTSLAGDIQTPGVVAPDSVTMDLLSLIESVLPVL